LRPYRHLLLEWFESGKRITTGIVILDIILKLSF
jgi:hypothetical protein